tara:strand:+ start:188 stop:709 length:522 start_codon:yes stop_codon:yes gene_type:complete
MILGLDISSSRVGIALMDGEKIIINEVMKFKSGMSLEERAQKFEQRMVEIEGHYVPYELYIEKPATMFKGGKTTAHTMAILQRFNGMCSYIAYKVFDLEPVMVNPRSARSKLGIKVPPRTPSKEMKKMIIEHISTRFPKQFKYELTVHGNPRPGTDDRADAIVVALAGPLLDN